MKTNRYLLMLTGYLFLALSGPRLPAAEVTLRISTPMTPPGWALLERELLQSSAQACEKFFARYFDERGYLECVARWGGDDGPDDAIENCNDWPILHALGAPQVVQHDALMHCESEHAQYFGGSRTASRRPKQNTGRLIGDHLDHPAGRHVQPATACPDSFRGHYGKFPLLSRSRAPSDCYHYLLRQRWALCCWPYVDDHPLSGAFDAFARLRRL